MLKEIFIIGGSVIKTKIPELRARYRLSQERLASAIGVTRLTINAIENGKYIASLPVAYKISKFFNLSIPEVFDLSDYDDDIEEENNGI